MAELKDKNNKASFFKIDTLLWVIKLLSFVFVLFQSCSTLRTDDCKDRRLKRDECILFEKIDRLVKADQENRNLLKLQKSKNENNNLDMDSVTYANWKDSIRTIQQKIDYKNSIELIKLTKKYGFPDNSRFSKKTSHGLFFSILQKN